MMRTCIGYNSCLKIYLKMGKFFFLNDICLHQSLSTLPYRKIEEYKNFKFFFKILNVDVFVFGFVLSFFYF